MWLYHVPFNARHIHYPYRRNSVYYLDFYSMKFFPNFLHHKHHISIFLMFTAEVTHTDTHTHTLITIHELMDNFEETDKKV